MTLALAARHAMPDSTSPTADDVLRDLNPEQRRAAEAVCGPVAILAGAGTGKTTTITHRIAWQVHSGAFSPRELLAVTFTRKAAGELRERLARLGVRGVEARTFHSTALWQLSHLWSHYTGRSMPEVMPSKGLLVEPIARRLPAPYCFRPRREIAGEIEWAKNRGIAADAYEQAVERSGRTPALPADVMARAFAQYEQAKTRAGRWDYEDALASLVHLLDEFPEAAGRLQSRFRAFTVDEYQDVNLLQQQLLDRWLGDRDDICVVGDDYQTIYSFTGATPEYLLGFAERHPQAQVVTLERNYRSTPQVLGLANAMASQMGGFRKELVAAAQEDGPPPETHWFGSTTAEVAAVVSRIRELAQAGVHYSQVAVLYRINARSEQYEEALAAAGIPYQVRGGAFLTRPAARESLRALRNGEASVVEAVDAVTARLGYAPDTQFADESESTRQADLGRLRQLARTYADAAGDTASVGGFVADLQARFESDTGADGVQLLTFHSAKGLEFDAVLLPGLVDGELPFRSKGVEADLDEERRLLYVGITRARRYLWLSAAGSGKAKPSPLLAAAGVKIARPPGATRGSSGAGPPVELDATGMSAFEALRAWRKRRAETDGVPAYVVFDNKTLAAIAEARPSSTVALGQVKGVGPVKVDRYGAEVLALLSADAG